MGELTTASEEMIKGQRLAKVFGAQDYEARRFEQVNERNRQLLMKRALTQAASNPVVQLVAAVPMAGIVYVATNASISLGESDGKQKSYSISHGSHSSESTNTNYNYSR